MLTDTGSGLAKLFLRIYRFSRSGGTRSKIDLPGGHNVSGIPIQSSCVSKMKWKSLINSGTLQSSAVPDVDAAEKIMNQIPGGGEVKKRV